MPISCPRILIAGTSGDSGKTVVSVGLGRTLSAQGRPVAAFKKGPDYIDASWLSAASGRVARNLDTFLTEPIAVRRSFIDNALRTTPAEPGGVNLIEGNRGLHDGLDEEGTHSSAALSKLIQCPVILVQDVTKTTRSAAAFVLGSQQIDPDVNIAGVIVNRVAGARHEGVVRKAIEKYTGIPVVGAIPKLPAECRIQSRHLGLVTTREQTGIDDLIDRLAQVVRDHVDIDRVLEIASAAPLLEEVGIRSDGASGSPDGGGRRSRICYLSDTAFSFYYPENFEALEEAGAELIPVSALDATTLPECDALYVGGGFPETQATALAGNTTFRESVYSAAEGGLPIYAECGGLIYMARELVWNGETFPMTGVFPVTIAIDRKPRGHGYARVLVDGKNPFFPEGLELKGHEFHYSWLADAGPSADAGASGRRIEDDSRTGLDAGASGRLRSVFKMQRGTGCGAGRDGLSRWNVLGTYLHVHALGCPAWAQGVMRAAERYRKD